MSRSQDATVIEMKDHDFKEQYLFDEREPRNGLFLLCIKCRHVAMLIGGICARTHPYEFFESFEKRNIVGSNMLTREEVPSCTEAKLMCLLL